MLLLQSYRYPCFLNSTDKQKVGMDRRETLPRVGGGQGGGNDEGRGAKEKGTDGKGGRKEQRI